MKGSVRWLGLVLVLLLAGGAFALSEARDAAPPPSGSAPAPPTGDARPGFVPRRAYLKQACRAPARWIRLVHRGWKPGPARAHDLVLVPVEGNFMGTFVNTSHSGPYDFLQEVPLVFYGPGYVSPQGRVEPGREVTLADVAPTYARLIGFDAFPDRDGRPLEGIVNYGAPPPRLVVTVSIDGGGWNVLRHWPEAWPNLRRLMEEGASIDGAIVGSSPSITPAVHTTLSTGAFPRAHGVTAIAVRTDAGRIVGAFSPRSGESGINGVAPRQTLRMPTLNDLWDEANANRVEAGMLSTGNYPLGMLGPGAARRGGDRDLLAIQIDDGWGTAPRFYSLPPRVRRAGPEPHVARADRADGRADGRWRGHEFAPLSASPAFPPWATEAAIRAMKARGFGRDGVTDLFWLHQKTPDYAGHKWNMVAEEQEVVLAAVDDSLGRLARWLDRTFPGRHLLVVTADHGQTPSDAGFAIDRREFAADVGRRFDRISNDRGIVEQSSATVLFLNRKELRANRVTAEQVASFLSRYRLRDNLVRGREVPARFRSRGEDLLFDAVFPGDRLPHVAACTGALRRD